MRRYILTILALCAVAFTTTVSAQESGSFSFGVKAGLNIGGASVHGYDIEGRDQYRAPKFGGVYGVMGEYRFKKKDFALSAEVLYSQQGVKYNYPSNPDYYDSDEDEYSGYEDYQVTYKFNYLNIPILFSYNLAFSEKVAFELKVGIQPGFLLSSKRSVKYSDENGSEEWEGYDPREPYGYYLFDLSVPMGIAYNITPKLVAEARYSLGVLDTFYELDHQETPRDFGHTNNTFALTLGYKF